VEKNNYTVIDNFLELNEFKILSEYMMGPYIQWHYNKSPTHDGYEDKDTMYFTHTFYNNNAPSCSNLNLIYPIIQKLSMKAIIRIKGNLYPNIGKKKTDLLHADYEYPHKGALFYINTNDGVTFFEDGTEVNSVANRILLFEPNKLHDSTYPTNEKVRVNINMNYF